MTKINQNTVRAYSIFDIAHWQTELEEKLDERLIAQAEEKEIIVLPTLQRGFVWKPYQMESLWDSILRGYPIGSLLLSENNNRKDLLDGQQRCTTIVLGFKNPFTETKRVLNISVKNIPTIWIDLKPLLTNKYGLNFGVRVLTRSHPWGYQSNNHRSTISTKDREDALKYFRHRSNNHEISFSELEVQFRTPWDAHYPIPLYMLLSPKTDDYSIWRNELQELIKSNLIGIKTKYGYVNYENIEETWLESMHKGVNAAKVLRIPEIMINKDVMLNDEEKFEKEEETTLFVRLNTEGTQISTQEIKYSILKAVFPEAKELVEQIDLKYISPSSLVNLYIRLVLMRNKDYTVFQGEIPLAKFRECLKDDIFQEDLIVLIKGGEAKNLIDKASEIISSHNTSLPKILYRELISTSHDLLLVLFAYLSKNRLVEETERVAIRNSFAHVFLFCEKKNQDKVAVSLYNKLKENNFSSWNDCIEEVKEQKTDEILQIPKPEIFKKMLLENVMPTYLTERKRHVYDIAFIEELIRKKDEIIGYLPSQKVEGEFKEEDTKNKEIMFAASNWSKLLRHLLRNKNFLMIAQKEYFNREFKDYMEFEGIRDTNRPWDWDHIYPNSWVRSKHNISNMVKMLANSNGNIRALSFNENRSQSNYQSPNMRFKDNTKAQKDSFVRANDLPYWLELTNKNDRLKEGVSKDKIDCFVKAVLTRISNIYSACFEVITEN